MCITWAFFWRICLKFVTESLDGKTQRMCTILNYLSMATSQTSLSTNWPTNKVINPYNFFRWLSILLKRGMVSLHVRKQHIHNILWGWYILSSQTSKVKINKYSWEIKKKKLMHRGITGDSVICGTVHCPDQASTSHVASLKAVVTDHICCC